MKVWIVWVEQSYASHFRIVEVFSTEELAKKEASKHPDTQIENFYVDRVW